jgi:hypothetical protein
MGSPGQKSGNPVEKSVPKWGKTGTNSLNNNDFSSNSPGKDHYNVNHLYYGLYFVITRESSKI